MNKYLSTFLKFPFSRLSKQNVVYYSMLDKPPTIQVDPEPLQIEDVPFRNQKLSRAMKHYLDKVTAYQKFMRDERNEFETGRRHLANMMGRDPETFTQADIDESIKYLFPCGLYQKKARPMMKPPEEIYPPRKEAAFNELGRPYHPLFYTMVPNLYQELHDAVKILKSLYELEDKIARGEENGENYHPCEMSGLRFISKEEAERKLTERLNRFEYEKLISTLKVIAEHPCSSHVQDFIHRYITLVSENVLKLRPPKQVIQEDNRKKVVYEGIHRKTSVVNVTAYYPGTGKFQIDDQDIHYFRNIEAKETVLFPLVLSKMINKVDIEATVQKHSGEIAVAGAIRFGISLCLANIVDENMKEKMRLAGLLQFDYRIRERKKAGQWGARRKFTWKKR